MAGEERKRVLYVDDEYKISGIAGMFLASKGYVVNTAAKNGAEALEIFRQKEFDFVVTDYGMPKMNGYTLAKKIKELSPKVPVIMVAAHIDEKVKAEIMASGAVNEFLEKGGDTNPRLLAAIQKYLTISP